MQQGVDKQINLGGIVRNTAGSTCPDGEMEEIINLRYKDGSLRPISDNETVPGLDNVEMEYQYITIHTCGYRHWLGVKDGALWYFADQDDDDRVVMKKQAISLCSVSQQQPKYSQAGNLLTVIDGDGIKYVYWKKGAYILSGIDYNGAQTATTVPPFDISFRVTPVTDSAGHQKIRAYSSDAPNTNWSDGKDDDTCDAAKIEQVKEREAAFGTLVNKAVKGIAQDGYAFGYRFACAALQTFDGNWVMQSAPFLIPCGNDKARNRGWTSYKSLYNKLENFAFAPNWDDIQIEKLPSGLYKGKVHISSDISDNKYTYPTWWKTYDYVLGNYGWFSDNDTLSAEKKNNRASRASSPLKYYYLSNNPYATVHDLAKDTVGDYYEYVNDTDFLDKKELLYTLTLNKGDKYTDTGNGKTYDTYTYIGKAEPTCMYPYDLFQPLFERECEYTKNADGKIETLKCYAKYPPTDGNKHKDHSWLVYNRCNGIFGRYTSIVHYDPVKWVRAEDTPYLFGYYVLGSTQYKNHVVNIPLNKLQYRLNHFDQIEKDLYPKFGIFVTKEVYPFKPNDFIESYPLYDKDPYHFEWQYLPYEENNFLNRSFTFYGKYFNKSGTITYVPYERSNKEITDMLFDAEKAIFYKIFEEDTDRVKASNGWIDLTPKDTFDWEHLQLLDQLNLDAINRSSFVPQVSYTYNGRLHLANYYENKFNGWPIHSFFDYRTAKECQWESDMVYTCFDDLKNDQQSMMGYFDALFGRFGWMNIKSESDLYEYQISVVTEDKEGQYRTLRYTGFTYSNNLYRGLNMLSYPDKRAKQMHITLFHYDGQNVAVWDDYFTLKEHPYWNMAYYLAPDLKPISLRFQNVSYYEGELPRDNDGYITKYNTLNSVDTKTRYPNYIKTSEVNNPLYFPDANTYQVGNVEILALSSNTTDLSTGQVGDAPLYVFAQDGIYGLFVDSSGVMTYSNSRPLARDILNNPFSVTPTDFGVVFTTDRGLMMIAGSQVIEIGQSAEGKYLDFTNANSFDNLPVAASAIDHERLVQLNDYKTDCEFKEYLKGAIIGYNFNEYELWVTNPNKDYTYIFALNQKQWFKRSISCTQYINNYPHLYILDSGKRVSDIDRETTSGNHCFFLTRPIKFDSQSFKQSYRSVVRGLFDLPELKRSSNYTTITLTGDKLKPDVRTIELIEQTKRAIAVEPFETEYRTIELQSVSLTPIRVVDSKDIIEIEYSEFNRRLGYERVVCYKLVQPKTEKDTFDLDAGIYKCGVINNRKDLMHFFRLTKACTITVADLLSRNYSDKGGAEITFDGATVDEIINDNVKGYKFINIDTQKTDPFTDGSIYAVCLQSDVFSPTTELWNFVNNKHLIIYDSKIINEWAYDTFSANFSQYRRQDYFIATNAENVDWGDIIDEGRKIYYRAGKPYLINLNHSMFQVTPPEDVTLTFDELSSVIRDWQRWYERIEDSIELSGNECYSISYRVGNVTGDDGYIAQHSFKYIGVGAGETEEYLVDDIIYALSTNDPDFAAIPSYYPETVELTSGEYIRIETTAGTTYEAHYTGGSGAVDTATLILDIANNKYTVQQCKDQEGVISNDVLTMTSGESVQFTDLDGNTYNFTYTGDNTITYENLLYNIKIAEKYAMLDDFGDTSISIAQNECIELIVKYADGAEAQYSFQYLDSKNPITLSQLLERINGGSASIGKIPTIDPLYKIYLPVGKIISFTDVDGKEYFIKIIPQGRKSKVAGFYVTYSELMQVLSKYDNPNNNEGLFYFYNNHYWYRVTSAVSGYRAGIYVFGSYDCRKWKFIGGNEVGDIDGRGSQVPNAIENINGEDNILFRDLGTLTERIDCKYFRICFVGQLLPESSIEYIDMSVESRLLGGKLR